MIWSSKFSYVTKALMDQGFYELTLKQLKKLVKPDYIALDIGANIGYYTLMLAQLVKKVYAFEPEPYNFAYLKKNVELNKYDNVILENYAVTDYNGTVDLYLSDICTGMHRIYPSQWATKKKITVETIRLDDYIQDADFVKIDVEGSEFGVLNGMPNLLKKIKVLRMEYVPECIVESGNDPNDILNLVKDFEVKPNEDKQNPIFVKP